MEENKNKIEVSERKIKKVNKPKIIKRAPLYRRLIDKFRRIFKGDNSDKVQFVKEFLGYVFIYGLLVNYMLTGIFGLNFSIWFFPSYGVLFYLIKEELPQIWAKFRPTRT